MKKILLICFALCSTFIGFSQKNIKVSESNENIGGAGNNALVVTIYTSKEAVEKGWKDVMKSWKGGSFSSKKDEMLIDDARIKDVGENTFDGYAKIEEDGEDAVRLIVAIDLGGAYLSSGQHPDQYKVFEKMIYEFAIKATKDAIGNKLKIEEKALAVLTAALKDLDKEKSSLEKDNEDMKKKITENEKSIEELLKSQGTKKEEIAAQEKIVKEVEDKIKGVK